MPESLAFGSLRANDDSYVVSPEVQLFDVLKNDIGGTAIRLVSVEQPAQGRAYVEDQQIRFEPLVADGAIAGSIELTYLVTDGTHTDEATVLISVINAGSDPAFASGIAPFRPFLEEDETDDVGDPSIRSIPRALPAPLLALIELRLPLMPLATSLVGLLFIIGYLRRLRLRRGFAGVTKVSRASFSGVSSSEGRWRLRHDAYGVWLTGRRRRDGSLRVHTMQGKGWATPEEVELLDPEN